MQLKQFVDSDPGAAARQANEWLTQNGVRVCHVAQSQSEKQGRFLFVLSIFFEPA